MMPASPDESAARPELVPPNSKNFAGLEVPRQFYPVLHEPAPLAGMPLPLPPWPEWESFYAAGFRWVVCLCSDHPRYDPAPLGHLAKVELADLVEGGEPEDPEMEERGICILGKRVHGKLSLGEGVIVHCAGGRGRTGTVLGIALRRFGYSAAEIVAYLDALHRTRGKTGWPESPWQREVVERGS